MPKYQTLIQLAPFIGLQTSTADTQTPAGEATAASNANPFRDKGAFCTALGRVGLATLAGSGTITALAPAAITGALRATYVATAANTVIQYQPDTATQSTVTNGFAFTQAFQYGIPLFTSVGQQIRGNNGAAPFKAYAWQYFWGQFTATGREPVWSTAAGTGTALTAQTYYYAFTLVTTFADGNSQESSPNNSAFSPFFIYYTLGAAGAIAITPGTLGTGQAWSGTNADGSTWTTNIYRQSTAQPTFLFVANMTGTVTATYNDDQSDAAIAPNAQLDLYRDAPPNTFPQTSFSPNDPAGGVIFTYKERAWNFVLRQDGDTNEIPQCQLWYSDYGTPWSFNGAYQVLLVGNGATALNPVYFGYGDGPASAVTLSSATLLHKQKSLYVLWGDDETTFVVRGIGKYGIAGWQSAAACPTMQGDLDCWLTPEGVYSCDGFTAPQYISEDIREALDAIPRSDWANSVGWYANRSYYLSFPATGVTYVYYFPSRKWRELPYGTNAAYAEPSEQPPSPGNQVYGLIVASRPNGLNSMILDMWDNAETDLGGSVVSSWNSPISDAGAPFAEKNYRVVVLQCPLNQSGVTAVVVLSVYDTGQAEPYVTTCPSTGSMDLSSGQYFTFPVPQESQKGYLAKLAVTLTNAPAATNFAEIYNVLVGGTIDREWTIPD